MTAPASASRRYLALFLPLLPADRWRLRHPDAPADQPLAFVEKQRGAMRIVAVDAAALRLGIAPGLTLADARARVPELAALDHDPRADALWLERIADGCDRWTPMVALDPPDGITLDISGAAHLFGGEAGLAADVERRIGTLGLHLRHAVAGTPEAAQALARFQTMPAPDEAAAVRRLPVSALRLEEEVAIALGRAGLKTIGDLAQRPSAPIAARFGAETVAALDRVIGHADSRITPRRALPALLFERRFAEPIAHTEAALAALAGLAGEAARTLEERHSGGRRFVARLYRSDGLTRDLAIATSLPTRDPQRVMRLMRERIEALSDPIDPGFGFDMVRLAVPVAEPLGAAQLALEGGAVSEEGLAALIERLGTRLGRGRVRRFAERDTHRPEQRALPLPAMDRSAPAPWRPPAAGEPPLRPLHLFDPPHRIEVLAEVPDGPPRRFRWRRTHHDVIRFEGPERIASEWWRVQVDRLPDPEPSVVHLHPGRDDLEEAGELAPAPHGRPRALLTRDYFRVEDARGRRFWLFRHGLYGRETDRPDWYLHGLFA